MLTNDIFSFEQLGPGLYVSMGDPSKAGLTIFVSFGFQFS